MLGKNAHGLSIWSARARFEKLGNLCRGEVPTQAQCVDLALWAHRRLPAKNSLTADHARAVEAAYKSRRPGQPDRVPDPSLQPRSTRSENEVALVNGSAANDQQPTPAETVLPLRRPVRRRHKVHLAFVAAQPCLICQRSPGDAHHMKFAQPNTLGRKVSDEFTVPLCRHHHALHRHGNEISWWANFQIAPVEVARELWRASPINGSSLDAAPGLDNSNARTIKLSSRPGS
jgi:hypothetical protein